MYNMSTLKYILLCSVVLVVAAEARSLFNTKSSKVYTLEKIPNHKGFKALDIPLTEDIVPKNAQEVIVFVGVSKYKHNY